VTIDDPRYPRCTLDVVVNSNRPEAERLCCERRGGEEPIDGTVLRQLPVRRFVNAATAAAAVELSGERGEALAERASGEGGGQGRLESASRGRKRGVPLTDEHFSRVADAYRAARGAGQAPTKTVAELMGASRSTAAHWVMEARRRGLLGPTRLRTAGEQEGER